MAAVIPNGVDDLLTAKDYVQRSPNPTEPQMTGIMSFFPDLNALFATCGLNVRQRYVLLRQGVTTIRLIPMLGKSKSSVVESLKAVNNVTAAKGGTHFGVIHMTAIAALAVYVQDAQRADRPIDVNGFSANVLDEYMWKLETLASASGTSGTRLLEVPDPKAKIDQDFITFENQLTNKLDSIKGENRVPLSYVIRDHPVPIPNGAYATNDERLIATTALSGPAYKADSSIVATYLYSILEDTPARPWFPGGLSTRSKDGRLIFTTLKGHYLGINERRAAVAKADVKLQKAVFKDEYRYPFDRVVGDLREAYLWHERYGGEVFQEARKITFLKDKCTHTNNKEFNIAATLVINANPNDYSKVIDGIKQLIPSYWPPRLGHQGRANYQVSQVQGRGFGGRNGGRGRGRGQGRGGRGRINGNDNDVSFTAGGVLLFKGHPVDLLKSYPPVEFRKFPRMVQQAISKAKKARTQPVSSDANTGISAIDLKSHMETQTNAIVAAIQGSLATPDESGTAVSEITTDTSYKRQAGNAFGPAAFGSKRPKSKEGE